jgi:GNAT superfamily N-acetyltransferase
MLQTEKSVAPRREEAVCVATPKFFNALMDTVRAGHAENGQHPLSLLKIGNIVWRGVTRQNSIIGVIGDETFVKAMVVLEIDPVYYSDDLVLSERLVYVRPENRRSEYAKQLLMFAKRCADETGLELTIGIISDQKLEPKRRLYERIFPLGGYWFSYRPQTPSGALN